MVLDEEVPAGQQGVQHEVQRGVGELDPAAHAHAQALPELLDGGDAGRAGLLERLGGRQVHHPECCTADRAPLYAARTMIGLGLFLMAVGAILKYAVTATLAGIDIQVVGVILLVIGIIVMLFGIARLIMDQQRRPPSGPPPGGYGGRPGAPPPTQY